MLNSFDAACLNGHIATTVSMCEIDLSVAHFKGLSLHVVFMLIPMLHGVKRAEHGKILKTLAGIVEAGHLKPSLDHVNFNLSEVGLAHQRLESGEAMGKIVIDHEGD